MSDTKFTAGPWSVRKDMYEFHDVVSENHVIAYSSGERGMTREEYEANAHLLAAAPELYAALEATAGYLADRTISDIELWEIVEPVLRKARGEAEPPIPIEIPDTDGDPDAVPA